MSLTDVARALAAPLPIRTRVTLLAFLLPAATFAAVADYGLTWRAVVAAPVDAVVVAAIVSAVSLLARLVVRAADETE